MSTNLEYTGDIPPDSPEDKAAGEAFVKFCRERKPPVSSRDTDDLATAVVAFSAGWKAGYAFDEMPDDLKQIQDLLAHAFIGKATTVIGKGLVERWESKIARLTAEAAALREAVAVLRAACKEALPTLDRGDGHARWGCEGIYQQVTAALAATSRFAEEPTP